MALDRPHNEACFICRHVACGEDPGDPVLFVSLDEEGFYFSCGAQGHTESDLLIVGLGEILDTDPALARMAEELPFDHQAHRTAAGAAWVVEPIADAA